MTRLPRSLRARMTLAAVVALALGGLVAGLLLLAAVERDGRRAVDAQLASQADGLGRETFGPRARRPFGPRRRFDPDRLRGPDRGDEGLLAGSGTFVQVELAGQVVRRRGDVPADPPSLPARDGLATVDIVGAPWRALTFTERSGPGRGARLQVLTSLAPVTERVAAIRGQVLGLGLAALILTAMLAWGLTTVALRPLGRLRTGAERVTGAADLGDPLPEDEHGPEEVLALARALNEMLTRLGAASEAQSRALEATRRFAADAGHELRTPLTGLRATLDTLARNPDLPAAERAELIEDTLAEQDRMVHLLEGLQALARGEAADSLPREDVELADLVDAAVYGAGRRHAGTAFGLTEAVEDAAVRGWDGGLRLVVDNLLDNAALHGAGRVEVIIEADAITEELVVRVEDGGAGIPPAERERLLKPFARGLDVQASGTGLGLAIVAQQVALHGGTLRLGDSPAGGLTAEVRLPAIRLPRRVGTPV